MSLSLACGGKICRKEGKTIFTYSSLKVLAGSAHSKRDGSFLAITTHPFITADVCFIHKSTNASVNCGFLRCASSICLRTLSILSSASFLISSCLLEALSLFVASATIARLIKISTAPAILKAFLCSMKTLRFSASFSDLGFRKVPIMKSTPSTSKARAKKHHVIWQPPQ